MARRAESPHGPLRRDLGVSDESGGSVISQVTVFLGTLLAGCSKESLILKLKGAIAGFAVICKGPSVVPRMLPGVWPPVVGRDGSPCLRASPTHQAAPSRPRGSSPGALGGIGQPPHLLVSLTRLRRAVGAQACVWHAWPLKALGSGRSPGGPGHQTGEGRWQAQGRASMWSCCVLGALLGSGAARPRSSCPELF